MSPGTSFKGPQRLPLSPGMGGSRARFDYPSETDRSFSYPRVHPGNSFHGSGGNELDSWPRASPSLSSEIHRNFALKPKHTGISNYSNPIGQSSHAGSKRTSSMENQNSFAAFASEYAKDPLPLRGRQVSVDSKGMKEADGCASARMHDMQEWQGPKKGEHEDGRGEEDIAQAMWRKRNYCRSTQYPICYRTGRVCFFSTFASFLFMCLYRGGK